MLFYAECLNQRRIIKILVGNVEVIHKGGRSSILQQIENFKNIVALVDRDPKTTLHPYLKKAKLIKKENGIELFVDKNKNRIILISPNLEEWIYKVANEDGVNLENYEFSKNPKSFTHEAKVSPTQFQKVIHSLRKNNNKKLKILEEFLKGDKF